MDERIFTLDEAQSLIPQLRGLLEEASVEWRRLKTLGPLVQGARDAAAFDGYSAHGADYVETVTHVMYVLGQIRDLGVLVKDVEQGLIDFPYMYKGKLVYLCWRLGEDSIQYWHDIESGFAGREPLDSEEA